MDSTPRFLQGVFGFEGERPRHARPRSTGATYTVPADKRAQLIYLRAGNSADELIYLVLMRDGKLMRYFPLGAKSAHARAAGGGRGPVPREHGSSSWSPRRRASPARSCSTSA